MKDSRIDDLRGFLDHFQGLRIRLALKRIREDNLTDLESIVLNNLNKILRTLMESERGNPADYKLDKIKL